MSKTIEAVGLIVVGAAIGAIGVVSGNPLLAGLGVSAMLGGIGIELRSTPKSVGTGSSISFQSGDAPRRVIYGQFQTAGVLTYASYPPSQNLALTNQYLHLIYTLAAHEITSFDAVSINGTVYNFGASTSSGDLIWDGSTLWHVNPQGGNPIDFYLQHMFFEFDFGRNSASQPFPNLAANDSGWTANCVQQGCAKVHVILRYDSGITALFPSGQIPNLQFLVTGKKIIDPRVVTAWQPSTGYVDFNYIVDGHGLVWVQTNSSGTSGVLASRPNFEGIGFTFPVTLADNTCSWTTYGFNQVGVSAGSDAAPQGHLVGNRLMNDAWLPGYTPGQYRIIEAPVGYLQQQTSAGGTTGASEPAFAKTVGATTTDGSVTWTCLGRSWNAINPSNSALVVNDYLQNSDWGFGAAASTIDSFATIAAANICEEQVTIIYNADGSTVLENLYACDGSFDYSQTRGTVLSSLCGSMAGYCVPPGDLWRIFAGSYQTPTIALGDTDFRDTVKGDFRLPKRDLANTMPADYIPAYLPSNPPAGLTLNQVPTIWTKQSAPEYQVNGLAGKPNYLNTEDGGQVIRAPKLQLDFTTSLWMAQRLEKIALMRLRFPQTLTLPCKLSAFQLEAGDTFSFTHKRWGIVSQTFEVTQWALVLDTRGASGGSKQAVSPALGVDLIARQTDPSIYEFQGPTSPSNFGEYSPYGITGVMTGVE
jgi:hypothetical protein